MFLSQRKAECAEIRVLSPVRRIFSYRERNQKVNVLVAEDKWYGVTYKEDKPAVVASIGELIDKGYYDGI